MFNSKIMQVPARQYRLAYKRQINYHFENERKKFKQDAKVYRKIHKEQYWNLQTQVENQYLLDYKNERIGKMTRDMVKWRTQICNIGLMTEKKFEWL